MIQIAGRKVILSNHLGSDSGGDYRAPSSDPELRWSQFDGTRWSGAVSLPELRADSGPALAVYNRKLVVLYHRYGENRLMKPSEPSQKQLSSSRQWHTDSSYRPKPSIGSLLHGIEISRTGGITQFINMYEVYEALPETLRRQIEGRRARHGGTSSCPSVK